MPRYAFRTCYGEHPRPAVIADCADDDAAQREAAAVFGDLARDIAGELPSNPKWQIEVADDAGKTIFRLSVLAEPLG